MHSCTVRQIVSATAISLRETDVHSKLLLRSLIVLLMYDHKPSSTASDLHLKLHVLDCISHRLFCAGQCILDSLEEFGICSPGHRSQTSRQSGHLVNTTARAAALAFTSCATRLRASPKTGVVKVLSAMGVSTGLLSSKDSSGSGNSSNVSKMSDNIMTVFPVPTENVILKYDFGVWRNHAQFFA